MSILQKILTPRTVALDPNDERYWSEWPGIVNTRSGVSVTPDSALTLAIVYACVRVATETMATLPMGTFQATDKGRLPRPDMQQHTLLHRMSNGWQTAVEFREMQQGHLELRGNGYSQIVPLRGGPFGALVPLHPDRVRIEQLPDTRLRYLVRDKDGRERSLMQDEVLHTKGLSGDGMHGYSTVSLMKETFGLAMSQERSQARFLGNSAQPSGVLTHPKVLSKEAQERLGASMDRAHGGSDLHGKTLVIDEGMDWKQMGLSNKDAEAVASRAFSNADCARSFRIPPHKVGILDKATFSNIEQQALEFVSDTVLPRAVRLEAAYWRDLLTQEQQEDGFYFKHNMDGLLRGDLKSRYEAYATARNWGWLNADEIRELEDRNPLPDGLGETYLEPLNMVPTGASREVSTATQGDATTVDVGGDASASLLRPIVTDKASQEIRREMNAVRRGALGNPSEGFDAWARNFYAGQSTRLQTVMHLNQANAEAYCHGHCAALIESGVRVMDAWDGEAETLVNLALEGKGMPE